MPLGGIKATRASALPKTTLAGFFGDPMWRLDAWWDAFGQKRMQKYNNFSIFANLLAKKCSETCIFLH
jgi:hypothetical protein